jgi:hypothetical protein
MFDLVQVTIRCSDIPAGEIAAAAHAVELDFQKYRPWHENVESWVENGDLIVRAQNDFDEEGDALCAELQSCLADHVSRFGKIAVVAVQPALLPSGSDRRRPGRARGLEREGFP